LIGCIFVSYVYKRIVTLSLCYIFLLKRGTYNYPIIKLMYDNVVCSTRTRWLYALAACFASAKVQTAKYFIAAVTVMNNKKQPSKQLYEWQTYLPNMIEFIKKLNYILQSQCLCLKQVCAMQTNGYQGFQEAFIAMDKKKWSVLTLD